MKRLRSSESAGALTAQLAELCGEALTYEEVHSLREALRDCYARKTAAITSDFFVTGADVFVALVLEPLALAVQPKGDGLRDLMRLKLVCRQWLALVPRVTRLALDYRASWPTGMYDYALIALPCVTSLHAHQSLLTFGDGRPVFARVTALELLALKPREQKYDTSVVPYVEFDMAHNWTQLRSLVFPRDTRQLHNIWLLTNLTHLEVKAKAFGDDPADLRFLVRLRSLVIRRFPGAQDFSALTALQSLDSDHPCHFSSYTGRGSLETDDYHCPYVGDDTEEACAYYGALTAYHQRCNSCCVTGSWVRGVFSGRVYRVEYTADDDGETGDGSDWFSGEYVDGKREGAGQEVLYEQRRVYHGHWSAGVRHGTGTSYTWPKGHLYWGERGLTALTLERWDRGRCVSVEQVPPVDVSGRLF